MFKKEAYKIGLTYKLAIRNELYDVTLIDVKDTQATVLIQNHSIDMTLNGFTPRKKMYSQAVPIQHVSLSELRHIPPKTTRRGLPGWFRSKIQL